jgi:hypothetical protein
MTRRHLNYAVLGLAIAAFSLSDLVIVAEEGAFQAAPAAGQQPAGRGGRGGRGRGAQQPPPPPPPPLTCTSPATQWDNVVPPALARDGFVALFNGKDLTGWQALIDIGTLRYGAGLNPADLDKLSPEERAAKQKESNDVYLKHWSVVDGILVFDGVGANKETGEKGGQNLQTVKEYGDVELYVDWCVDDGADSGVYLKNAPQIQIWFNPLGSGGLYNNQNGPRHPLVVADNPANRWNTFHIIQRDNDMTTIWLNGQLVVNNVKMENYWDRSQPLRARGNIELQYHGDKLYWKNIFVKELN